jgi:hypothetical protein
MRLRVRPTFLLFGCGLLLLLLPKQSAAVPQFARRYNLKCSACHTIVPVLNEQGYMFKRFGYHLPPTLEAGKGAPSISDLVNQQDAAPQLRGGVPYNRVDALVSGVQEDGRVGAVTDG